MLKCKCGERKYFKLDPKHSTVTCRSCGETWVIDLVEKAKKTDG